MTWLGGTHPDELISASLSGDLADAERAALDTHLASCQACRETLAAFTAERHLVSGLRSVTPPRELGARVRGGIESRRFASDPWWRRRGGVVALVASATTVAAAVLAIIVLGKLPFGPVGETGSPEASASVAPSSSAIESTVPSVEPTAPPLLALEPGDLGYLSLNGAPFEALRLTFINDATGASVDAGTVSGPPIAAALSPDGGWLAYITQKGESGANEVWALHLTDGAPLHLGCSMAAPFTDRLAWSPDSLFLAYTLVAIDLGEASGCAANNGAQGSADAWVFDIATGERSNITGTGNAYAASFLPDSDQRTLLVSFAAETPWTEAAPLVADVSDFERVDRVFLPLYSPDGNRAIFWSGMMASSDGGWQFSPGGMPQLSGDFRSTGPASPWLGTPLFTDLTPVRGEAFASGSFAWGADGDLVAFWNGAWTGAPQSADETYPSQLDVHVGRVSGGLLSAASRLSLALPDLARVVDVVLAPDGLSAAVTIGLPSAGIGDPPSAYLEVVPLDGGEPRPIGGGVEPPPWNGPAVFGR
jgi:hypothetical protein